MWTHVANLEHERVAGEAGTASQEGMVQGWGRPKGQVRRAEPTAAVMVSRRHGHDATCSASDEGFDTNLTWCFFTVASFLRFCRAGDMGGKVWFAFFFIRCVSIVTF